ncbi:hypothetical protein WN48_04794 [Eufriesea mexicana]|uniref:Uncharacterized protein n=1 Tax=Eufriesea mexicana TaxID=516756 RepID=A0A310SDM3_9HYME|nr:hypothetical protein WN48_04794 [Eufriesea mexicana]
MAPPWCHAKTIRQMPMTPRWYHPQMTSQSYRHQTKEPVQTWMPDISGIRTEGVNPRVPQRVETSLLRRPRDFSKITLVLSENTVDIPIVDNLCGIETDRADSMYSTVADRRPKGKGRDERFILGLLVDSSVRLSSRPYLRSGLLRKSQGWPLEGHPRVCLAIHSWFESTLRPYTVTSGVVEVGKKLKARRTFLTQSQELFAIRGCSSRYARAFIYAAQVLDTVLTGDLAQFGSIDQQLVNEFTSPLSWQENSKNPPFGGGAIFTHDQKDSSTELAFKYAVYKINKERHILPKTTLEYDIQYVPKDDSFHASKKGVFHGRKAAAAAPRNLQIMEPTASLKGLKHRLSQAYPAIVFQSRVNDVRAAAALFAI